MRDALFRVVLAWVFGSAWMFITGGIALTQFGKHLGMTDSGFGWLVAVTASAALLQLPASYFLGRFGHRKRILLIAGIANRAVWFLIALVPWLVPTGWKWQGVLVLVAASAMCGNVMAPAVLSWFADLVPRRIGGRYFSRRTQIGRTVGLVTMLAVGFILDWAEARGDRALVRTISALFAFAALCGVTDFLMLIPVPDDGYRPMPKLGLFKLFREPLADRSFRRYVGFTATMNLGCAFVLQFALLYLIDVAGLSNKQVNLMLYVVPMIVGITTAPLWGRLIDRIGCKPSLMLATLLIFHGAIAWAFVRKDHWIPGYLALLVSSAAWPGVELASFNILLRMSASHGGRRQGSAYVAVNSVVVALAGVLSGLFAGSIAKGFHDWHSSILGWPLTYHAILFLASGILRLLAICWLIGFEEPRSHSLGGAVRSLVAGIATAPRRAGRRLAGLAARLLGR
jgi:MFS family permease